PLLGGAQRVVELVDGDAEVPGDRGDLLVGLRVRLRLRLALGVRALFHGGLRRRGALAGRDSAGVGSGGRAGGRRQRDGADGHGGHLAAQVRTGHGRVPPCVAGRARLVRPDNEETGPTSRPLPTKLRKSLGVLLAGTLSSTAVY